MFFSIKAKVVTIYSLVMVSFISILLLIIFLNEKSQILGLALENSLKISQLHAENIDQEFAKYIAMLKIVSADPEVQSNNKVAIIRLLNKLIIVSDSNFSNAIYIDRNFNLTNASGSTQKVTRSLFLERRQWENSEYIVTAPTFNRFNMKSVIIVAVPILNKQSKWVGTIGVAVPLHVISEKLSTLKLSKKSYAWLADSNDIVVSHPDERVAMNMSLSTIESPRFIDFYKVIEQTKIKEMGYGRYHDVEKDEAKIVTFSKMTHLPDWTFFITTKESDIFQDINKILRNILITSIALTFIFLLVISELSKRVTRKLIQLTQDVKESVKGGCSDFNVINSNDEIGELSKAFSDTFNKISSHTLHLEKLVVNRTKEIAEKNLLLNKQNNKLEQLAGKDSLTGLYNRRAFNELVDKAILKSKKHDYKLTLVILDLDDFKDINDAYGHNVGDEVLRQFSAQLTLCMRKTNIICRWGGEEFVILMPDTAPDIVFNRIETTQEKMTEIDFSPAGYVTFSAGVATLGSDEPFNKCLQRADLALYEAKAAGKSCIIEA